MSERNEQTVVHTPGPWTLGDENNQCCEVLLGVEHNLTIYLNRQDKNTGKFVIERDEMLANARLIAAVPDLLAAVRALCDIHDDDLPYAFDEWRAARAAIAKATGEVV